MNIQNIFDDRYNRFLYDDNNNINNNNDIWVFGYGSLCWHPGFSYTKCITGYIRGYSRKFWQGNTTHRGIPGKPGRVATLIEDKEAITWGCAYKINYQDALTKLEYLKKRECTLGGYVTLDTKFYPRLASGNTDEISGEAIPALVYIATEKNDHWLGDTSDKEIAEQIVNSTGPSGHNVEYLLRLAKFMKEELPGAYDEHLFTLERLVLEILNSKNIPLISVMGSNPQRIRRDSHENIRLVTTFEFASRISERKLRCLHI